MSIVITRRKSLLVGGASVAAAFGGLVAAGGPFAGSAPSASQDQDILAFALGLERLETGFYGAAAKAGALQGELAEFVTTVLEQEREHVRFLEAALGTNSPAAAPFTADVDAIVRDPDRFARTSAALEDAIVAAYNGQAANLTKGTLAKAATIVSVEARHAAWIRDIAGLSPAASPSDAPKSVDEVRAALRKEGLLA
jgi:rubrerythrin